jgi:hypothetical protein
MKDDNGPRGTDGDGAFTSAYVLHYVDGQPNVAHETTSRPTDKNGSKVRTPFSIVGPVPS